eukprot:6187939-Pleurochrysis_carterae.AAC.1
MQLLQPHAGDGGGDGVGAGDADLSHLVTWLTKLGLRLKSHLQFARGKSRRAWMGYGLIDLHRFAGLDWAAAPCVRTQRQAQPRPRAKASLAYCSCREGII